MAEWYDDPAFDGQSERHGGKWLQGEAWRRLQSAKERGLDQVVAAAGTTFRAGHVKAAMRANRNVAIVPEPDNPADNEARRVEVCGWHVGYVPRGSPLSPGSRAEVIKMGTSPQPHVWIAVGA